MKFVFSNVAYRPTVYKTGTDANQSDDRKKELPNIILFSIFCTAMGSNWQ